MDKISPIKENILYFIDNQKIKKEDFYKKTDISASNFKGTGLKSEIGGDKIVKILSSYPIINPEWLLTGKGEMLKKKKAYYDNNNDVVIQESRTHYELSNKIPLVSIKAIGGFGNNSFTIEERDVKDYYVIPKFKNKRIDFMIEVEGSSMYPKYNSGDVVACTILKESTFLQWNKTHVIATKEQGIIIKRIKKASADDKLCMISDNGNYDPFEVPKEEITGIALVVGVIRLE